MGVIYQQHPKHGIHVATTEEEAAANRANGWTEWTPGDPVPLSPNEPIPAAAPVTDTSEIDLLKAQMALLLKRLDDAEGGKVQTDPPVETKKAETKKAETKAPKVEAPAAADGVVPDFLKNSEPQG